VLHTREVGSALSRWLGRRAVEVTASAELAAPRRLPRPAIVADASNTALAKRLARTGISPATSARWLARLDAELTCDPEAHADRASQRLRQIVEADLPVRGEIRLVSPGPTIVALIGPTGVGKTTTLAKLAAHFRLHEHCRVSLITIDTFRIGAIEQLRTYAEIMRLPLEVVSTPREMAAAVGRLAESDLILVDTPGRSPHDSARLLELRATLAAARPHETLLVLSGASGSGSFYEAAGAFRGLLATSLILTKLDEAAELGKLPDWLASSGLPISYTTHGQNVPGDILPAAAARLAELLLSDS
jgi:flagellar biosynthesis protein FlhF